MRQHVETAIQIVTVDDDQIELERSNFAERRVVHCGVMHATKSFAITLKTVLFRIASSRSSALCNAPARQFSGGG